MGQLKAPFPMQALVQSAGIDLIEDLDDVPVLPDSPVKQALIFVLGSLGFMALASLALWSGFQYEANRRRLPDQPLIVQPPPSPADIEPIVATIIEPTKLAKEPIEDVEVSEADSLTEVATSTTESQSTTPSAAPPVVATDLPAAIRLVGVIADSGESLQALLMIDNILIPLGTGEPIDRGWYVASVQRERVVLSNGSRSHTLQLGLTGQL